MSDVYSYRFCALEIDAPWTSPPFADGFVYVARCLDTVGQGPESTGGIQWVGNLGQMIWENDYSPLGFTYGSWRGRQVFYAGEVFGFNTDLPVHITLSGFQLRLP